MQHAKVKDIVILGGGTAGWMVAAALSKAIGCQTHNIKLIESEEIGTIGVGEATIPLIMLFNNGLGLDENEFIRETNATFKLGIEFVNWRKLGHSYFHPFGFYGSDMDGVAFMHYWQRWHQEGGNLDYSKFSIETEAARAGKFLRTANELNSTGLPNINYAFQFDAALYAAFLRRYSEQRGVARQEGKVVDVKLHPDTGYIQSLILQSGQAISGDFFIDCSGFKGLLIEQVYGAGYQDWSHWLPVNRAAAVPCENSGPLTPYTRSTAQEFGWQWRIPLQHRTGNGYVYCDQYISEDKAANKLLERLDGKALAEPRTLRFVTGMRKKCWIKNCLAVGLAGGFLEPLESTSIHLVQATIAKLLAMFPKEDFNELMIKRFNHEMEMEYDNIKDFLIAHYKVTEREDTPFWKYVKQMSIPDSLQERLEIFKSRGEAMSRQHELFKDGSWYSVLVGQGMMPNSYHTIADSLSDDELRLRLTRIRNSIQQRLGEMPSHEEFIQKNCESKMSNLNTK